MQKSKCIKCEFKGEKETQYGKLYNYFVVFENGDQGAYSCKDQSKVFFKEGEEAEYEKTSQEFNGMVFFKIKPHYENKGNFGKPQNTRGMFACNAMTNAIEFCKFTMGADANLDQVKFAAVQIFNWLVDTNDNKQPQ